MVDLIEHIDAIAESDDFIVEMRTGLHHLKPVIDTLTIRRKDGQGVGVSPTALRSIGFGDLLERTIERGTFRHIRDPKTGLWNLEPESPNDDEMVDQARSFVPRKGRAPTPAGQIEAEVRAAADAYRDAIRSGKHAPIKHVAGRLNVSDKTAQRRVRDARTRGLLED